MDRFGRDRDNAGGGGRPLHTYTPRSHEDLLRSHLQLDASRNAKLQSGLQRLTEENRNLRRALDDAQKEINDKEDKIKDLKEKLQEKPPPPRSSIPEDKIFEIDGKPFTLDQIINHFDGVIQKHHNLLDKKNKQIEDLENALRNRPPPYSRNDTRSPTQGDNKQAEDLAKEIALIRKEYEQVEKILTERNNKLENLIEDLKKKLDQYADEIGRLRQELANKEMEPRNSTLLLLREKEKENEYLKDLINNLKSQPQQNYILPNTNEDLENEIKKIIEDKKKAVKRLSNMIIDLKNTSSGNETETPEKIDLEKDCKEMMDDLNNMNDKLNNLMDKIKQKPQGTRGESVNKDDLLNSLTNLKKQCEDEINALKNQLKDSPSSEKPVILTGIGRVKIDDPELLKRRYPDGHLPDEPVNVPSNVEFYLYPTPGAPPDRQAPRRRYDDADYVQPISRAPNPTPESSLKSYIPVDYTPITPEMSFKQMPVYEKEKPKGRIYPEIPSETKSIPPISRKHPTSCEACQDDYPPRKPQFYEEKPPAKPNKKGCCGGKKGSDSSNVPYEKVPQSNVPLRTDREEVIYIHQPNSTPKPKKKLIYKFKADRHK